MEREKSGCINMFYLPFLSYYNIFAWFKAFRIINLCAQWQKNFFFVFFICTCERVYLLYCACRFYCRMQSKALNPGLDSPIDWRVKASSALFAIRHGLDNTLEHQTENVTTEIQSIWVLKGPYHFGSAIIIGRKDSSKNLVAFSCSTSSLNGTK